MLTVTQALSSQEPDPLPPPGQEASPLERAIAGSLSPRALQEQLVAMKALVNYAKNPTPKNKSHLPEQYRTHDTVIALETAYRKLKALEPETSQHPTFKIK